VQISPKGLALIKERWIPVPDWDDFYEVSDQGRVRSLDRVVVDRNGRRMAYAGRLIAPRLNRKTGYTAVVLARPGVRLTRAIHVLVASAWLGPRPDGMEVRHGENGKLDNSLANLCYGTPKQNGEDKVRDGVSGRGEKNGGAKLSELQVRVARHACPPTGRPKGLLAALAREWGVNGQTLSDAISGRNWGHLTQPAF
jgi:hypothetical protein